MGNGIFLGTSVIDGVPTLFQYTMRPDDPVVIVEVYKPSAEDLVPRAVDMSTAFGHSLVTEDRVKSVRRHLKEEGVISEGSVDNGGRYHSGPTYFPSGIAQRLVERVLDDAVFASGGNEEFVFSQPLSESFAAKGDKFITAADVPHTLNRIKGDPDAES